MPHPVNSIQCVVKIIGRTELYATSRGASFIKIPSLIIEDGAETHIDIYAPLDVADPKSQQAIKGKTIHVEGHLRHRRWLTDNIDTLLQHVIEATKITPA